MVEPCAALVGCRAAVAAPVGNGREEAEIGWVTADPSTFSAPAADTVAAFPPCWIVVNQGVVFAVFPGCTVHVPLCVTATEPETLMEPETGWVTPEPSVRIAPAAVREMGLDCPVPYDGAAVVTAPKDRQPVWPDVVEACVTLVG